MILQVQLPPQLGHIRAQTIIQFSIRTILFLLECWIIGWLYRPTILENRVYLITLIGIVTTIAALIPFFLGTVFSYELLMHDLIHITGITFGVFLTTLSVYAYRTLKNKSLIFTAFAFATFVVASVAMLENDMGHAQIGEHGHCDILHYPCIDDSASELVVETLFTVMIGLFAIGVFWNSKKNTQYT